MGMKTTDDASLGIRVPNLGQPEGDPILLPQRGKIIHFEKKKNNMKLKLRIRRRSTTTTAWQGTAAAAGQHYLALYVEEVCYLESMRS